MPTSSVTAIVMIGPTGFTAIEQQMGVARRLAARDMCAALRRMPQVGRVIIAAPASEQAELAELDLYDPVWDVDPPARPFHFGYRLAEIVRRHAVTRMVYIGAGSMPLLPEAQLGEALAEVVHSAGPLTIANNVHSADWAALSDAGVVQPMAHRLERDNMLAWVLREEAGLPVKTLPPSAGTRQDIDTPFDLQVLALHPRTQAHLRQWLQSVESTLNLDILRRAVEILRTPGSRITLIGRVASSAWALLEAQSRCWTRVLSEERGMAANRRQTTGQVFSIVADHVARVGEAEFMAQLGRTSDLVLFDTRVYLAHHRSWPSAADRFASDWGRPDQIADGRLRRLTEAALAAPLPVILGGHNVVSGGVYSLLEIAAQ